MGQYKCSKQVLGKTTVFHKSAIHFGLSHSFILFLCLSNPEKAGHAKATQLWKMSICLSFQSKTSYTLISLIFTHYKFSHSESAQKINSAQNSPFFAYLGKQKLILCQFLRHLICHKISIIPSYNIILSKVAPYGKVTW